MGELQLGQSLEISYLAQYERELSAVPQSSERVEYAIKLQDRRGASLSAD